MAATLIFLTIRNVVMEINAFPTGENSFELTSTFLLVFVNSSLQIEINTGLLHSLEERYGRRVDIWKNVHNMYFVCTSIVCCYYHGCSCSLVWSVTPVKELIVLKLLSAPSNISKMFYKVAELITCSIFYIRSIK